MNDRIEAEAPKDKVSSGANLLQEFEISPAGFSQLKAGDNQTAMQHLPEVTLNDSEAKAVTKPADKNHEETPAAKEQPALAEHGKVSEHIPASANSPMEYTKYEDGTQRQEFATGDIIETRPDGTYIHMKPDHTMTIVKDGKTTIIEPNAERDFKSAKVDDGGNVSIDYKDGANEFFGEDGSYGITFPDKSGYFVEPDGGTMIYHANGVNKTYNPAGEQISEWTHDDSGARIHYPKNRQVDSVIAPGPDGKRRDFLYGPDGKLEQFDGHLGTWKKETQDGKDVWVNQQSKQVWDGKFDVDKDGNLHYKPNNGGQEWVFTPDGRDIKK